MINTNLIKSLLPNNMPTYCYILNDAIQYSDCNQDVIEFNFHKIKKNILEIENEEDISEKTLKIHTNLDIDENGNYKTKLLGYISPTKDIEPDRVGESSHFIEVIQTRLKKQIEINFNETYNIIPSIVINIDEKYKSLFRSCSCSYKQNSNNEYIGVIISFNNLKTKNWYPDIKITIIGDLYYVCEDVTLDITQNNNINNNEE